MGATIGHYDIVGELGRGGMGVVYKAHDQSLDRYVAIKQLSGTLADDTNLRARFTREARSAAALNHPNVIQVYFVGEEAGAPYFAMEFVEGQSLAQLIRANGMMDPLRAAEILRQTATGLAEAHDKGIIHRDIKPANIMINHQGLVKVTDFGIAHVADVGEKLTSTGQFLGTPGYLAPEVCRGEAPTACSDIFALGIVYYEMLTAMMPYQFDSIFSMIREITEKDVPDPKILNDAVDEQTRTILKHMTQRAISERYSECRSLIADLKTYLGNREVSLLPATSDAGVEVVPTVRISQASNVDPTVAVQTAEAQGKLAPTVVIPDSDEVHQNPPPLPTVAESEAPLTPPPVRQTMPPPPPRQQVVTPPVYQPTVAATPSKRKQPIWLIAAALVAAAALGFFLLKPEPQKTIEPTVEKTKKEVEHKTQPPSPSPPIGDTKPLEKKPISKETDPQKDPATITAPGTQTVTGTLNEPPSKTPQNVQALTNDQNPPTGITKPDRTNDSVVQAAKSNFKKDQPGKTTVQHTVKGIEVRPSMEQRIDVELPVQPAARVPDNPRLALVITGDSLLGDPIQHYLADLFKEESYEVIDGRDLDIGHLLDGRPSLKTLGTEVARNGADLLILTEIKHQGERQVRAMGRTNTLYKAAVVYRCYFPAGDHAMGSTVRETVEYNSFNAENKGEMQANQVIDALLKNIRPEDKNK